MHVVVRLLNFYLIRTDATIIIILGNSDHSSRCKLSSINTASKLHLSISFTLQVQPQSINIINMKFLALFLALIVGLIGFTSATICARDQRSGGAQNFGSINAMYAENSRGGRKFSYLHLFYF